MRNALCVNRGPLIHPSAGQGGGGEWTGELRCKRHSRAQAQLAREFREEYRQALDWLNQRTSDETAFLGVRVEVWRLDDSRPAPHFNLVAAAVARRLVEIGGLLHTPSCTRGGKEAAGLFLTSRGGEWPSHRARPGQSNFLLRQWESWNTLERLAKVAGPLVPGSRRPLVGTRRRGAGYPQARYAA